MDRQTQGGRDPAAGQDGQTDTRWQRSQGIAAEAPLGCSAAGALQAGARYPCPVSPRCPGCHKALLARLRRAQQNGNSSLARGALWAWGRGRPEDTLPCQRGRGLLHDGDAALASLKCLFLSRGLLAVAVCPICHSEGHKQKLPRKAALVWTLPTGLPAQGRAQPRVALPAQPGSCGTAVSKAR